MLQYQVLAQGIWTRIFGKPLQCEADCPETEQTKWFDVSINSLSGRYRKFGDDSRKIISIAGLHVIVFSVYHSKLVCLQL